MADITKCTAVNCDIKEMCYRYIANDDEYQSFANFNNDKYQSFANFNNDKEVKEKKNCPYYWKSSKEGEVENERNIRK